MSGSFVRPPNGKACLVQLLRAGDDRVDTAYVADQFSVTLHFAPGEGPYLVNITCGGYRVFTSEALALMTTQESFAAGKIDPRRRLDSDGCRELDGIEAKRALAPLVQAFEKARLAPIREVHIGAPKACLHETYALFVRSAISVDLVCTGSFPHACLMVTSPSNRDCDKRVISLDDKRGLAVCNELRGGIARARMRQGNGRETLMCFASTRGNKASGTLRRRRCRRAQSSLDGRGGVDASPRAVCPSFRIARSDRFDFETFAPTDNRKLICYGLPVACVVAFPSLAGNHRSKR